MLRSVILSLSLSLALAGACSAGQAAPEGTPPATAESGPPSRTAPADLAGRVWAISDAVLAHHLQPPARQQMILHGLDAVYRGARVDPPADLPQRVSAITSVTELTPLLDALWRLAPRGKITLKSERGEHAVPIEDLLTDGLLANVAGRPSLDVTKNLAAEQQMASNNYVGLHIAAGYDEEAKRTRVAEVFKGGPGDIAGLKTGDLIEDIDGVSTEGLSLREVITDRLRGPLGSRVVLRVRQPGATELRTIAATRGLMPRQTLEGIRKLEGGGVEVLIRGPGPIAYLKFKEITGSTRQELRALARRIDEEGARAVILDLRAASNAELHSAVLLADSLLESGTIGRVRSRDRVETFEAEPDALFRGLPLAVLVHGNSPGTVQWLAAALQDQHRATIVGGFAYGPQPGGGRVIRRGGGPIENDPDDFARVRTVVPVGDGTWSIAMPTGRLERGDGRLLAPAVSPRGDPRRPQTQPRVEGTEPEAAKPGTKPRDGRLVPDIVVGDPSGGGTPPSDSGGETENDPNVRGDAILTAAVRHLREVLSTR